MRKFAPTKISHYMLLDPLR